MTQDGADLVISTEPTGQTFIFQNAIWMTFLGPAGSLRPDRRGQPRDPLWSFGGVVDPQGPHRSADPEAPAGELTDGFQTQSGDAAVNEQPPHDNHSMGDHGSMDMDPEMEMDGEMGMDSGTDMPSDSEPSSLSLLSVEPAASGLLVSATITGGWSGTFTTSR